MKAIFKSKDIKEINRITKSLDMAIALFEIQENLHRKFEDINFQPIQEAINLILEENCIQMDDILD